MSSNFYSSLFPLLLFVCSFSLSAQETCTDASSGTLTYNGDAFEDRPSPFYADGETVEVCFALGGDFNTPDVEWVHGIFLVDAGPGFILASSGPSGPPPGSCNANGNWAYYNSWTRCMTNCPTQTTFGPGYGFDSSQGTGTCGAPGVLDGNPGNNFGDNEGACGLVFCWALTTTNPGGVGAAEAYAISIKVTADGVSGGYAGNVGGFCRSPCSNDVDICFPEVPDPFVDILNEPCAGELFQLQGGPVTSGVDAQWTDENGVVVANGYNASLPTGTYTFALARPNCAPKNVEVVAELVLPEVTYDGPMDGEFFCHGEPIVMSVIVDNATVNQISWLLGGSVVATGASYNIASASVANAGLYTLNVNYGNGNNGAGCDTMFMFRLNVGDEITTLISPADGTVCLNEELTFTATQPDGSPYPDDVLLEWDGGIGIGDEYVLFADGATGLRQVQLTITRPFTVNGVEYFCSEDFTQDYFVFSPPSVTVDLPDTDVHICFGETLVVTSTVTGGTPPYTYYWGPDMDEVASGPTYTIAPPYNMTTNGIYVSVEDANGCRVFSDNSGFVIVDDPPSRPVVTCNPICVSEIEFSWTSINADFFALYVRINNGPEMLIDDNYIGLNYLVAGLNAGDEVDFRVVPYSGDPANPTGGCIGQDRIRTCETPLTSTPGFTTDFPLSVCGDGSASTVDIGIGAGEPGTFTFTNTDLGLNQSPADADGVTTINLPALPTGITSTVYDVLVEYEGVGGRCPSDTTIQLVVTRSPDAEFTLDNTTLCGTSGTFNATLVTPPNGSDVYNFFFENPLAGSITGNETSGWAANVTLAGTHTVVLASANSVDPNCVDTVRAQVTLAAPLPAVTLQCGNVGLDFVNFTWSDTGHDSYTVNEIVVPDYATVTLAGNMVNVTGLMVGDEVTISINGVTAGCPNVTSAEMTCRAENCPEITIDILPVGPFCADVDQVITLDTARTGPNDGTGVVTWELDGAVFDGTFNPSELSVGVHVVELLLEEGCEFRASESIVINAIPSPALNLPNGPICTGTQVVGAAAGAVQAGFTYDFSAPGATVTPGTNAASRNLSWPAAGRYFVSLTVTSANGCTGETVTDSIDVVAPLVSPVVVCDTATTESITFAWDLQPGVDSFAVSVDNGPVFYQDSTSLFVDGLTINQAVDISVTAIGGMPCPNPPAGTRTCITPACPSLMVALPQDTTFCSGDAPLQYLLTTTVTGDMGGGILSFTGPGVVQVGPDFFFDVDVAGIGTHELTVNFEEGMCMSNQNFTYTVTETPTSDFTVNGLTTSIDVCIGDIFEVAYTGNLTVADGGVFTYFYDPAPPASSDTVGFQTYRCSYDSPGIYEICLVTSLDPCFSDTTCITINCVAPPEPPIVNCTAIDRNTVVFSWTAVAGADFYNLFFEDGTTQTTTDLEYTFNGLMPGETVTLEVTAQSNSGLCPDSGVFMPATCSALPCPAFTANLSTIPGEICILDGTEFISLTEITVDGSDDSGIFSFNGMGVSQDTFFAATVPFDEAGTTYTISMTYEETGPCTVDTTFDITVFRRPTAFITDPGAQCVGDTTLIRVGSTNLVSNNDVMTDFADGTVIPDGNPDDTDYLVVFPGAGTRTITATVISNISGCPSEPTTLDIEVIAPLPAPALVCATATLETAEITWTDIPGATGFTVTTSNGQSETLPAGTTSYTAVGLLPSTVVTFTVSALGDAPCGNGPAQTIMCSSMDCPGGVVQIDTPAGSQCLDGNEVPVLLEASLTSGDPFNGPVVWSGTGVVDNGDGTFSFDPAGLAAGDYTVTVSYDGPSNCDSEATVVLTLFDVPVIGFSAVPAEVCQGEEFNVSFTGTAEDGDEFVWDFGDAVVTDLGTESYTLSWDTPGNRTVSLTVNGNCSTTGSFDVAVIAPLPVPDLTCGAATLETVEVTWTDIPEATGFAVTTSNGQSETLPAGSTSYVAIGLLPSTDVTFTVTALGGAPCGDGTAQTLNCRTMDCPGGVVQTDTPAGSQCLDGNEVPVLLEASLTSGDPFNGPVVWSGTGVVDNGNGTFSFDPSGLGAGDYTVTVNYDGPSNCDSEASVVLTLFDVPIIGFNAMPTQLCQGEEFNIFFTGTAEDGDEFVWDFDGAVVNDLGAESYLLRWDTPGIRTVTLTVNGNCSATANFEINVIPTLPAPIVNCARQDLDGVFFNWADIPAATEGYRVSINGAPYGMIQDSTGFFVGGLDFGENVTITVISVRSGTNCDESAPSASVDCAARECPDVTLVPSSPQTAFCDDETEPVILSANLTGDDGTGDVTWTGPGIVNDNGTFAFDPVLAGVGTHTLTVTYVQEELCSYTATLEIAVNATPVAAIAQQVSVTCAGTAVSFGLDGTAEPGTTYTFDFDGAAVNDLANDNYEISYAAGGTYTIILTAERNGCMSSASTTLTVEEEVFAGTPVSGVLEVCAGTTDPIDLSSRVVNATEGGIWAAVSGGVPNGSLDPVTGNLNPAGLGAGTYTFSYTVDGGSCPEDVAEVMVDLLAAPVADAGPGQRLTCNMGMVSLDGSNSESGDGYTYLWTSENPNVVITDADQLMIDVGQPGVYQLRVTNAIGCSAVSEVTVTAETEAPVMELEVSNITCFSSDNGAISVTNVNGGRPPYTFSLNGEDRGQSTLFANLEPGAYDVQITDANGCFSNVILDLTQPDELTVRLQFPGDSATTTAGTEIFITATVNGGNPLDTLIWRPDSVTVGDGQNGISFTATETQMISVTVVDELGCTASDQMMLLVRRDRPVYFPTAFSPNGDNINDIFFIGGDLDQIDFISDFLIFDRWGEAVYTGPQNRVDGMGTNTGEGFLPNDPAFGWDGMLKGRPMNPQVLVYTATVHFSDGEVIVYKGDFVLMR